MLVLSLESCDGPGTLYIVSYHTMILDDLNFDIYFAS